MNRRFVLLVIVLAIVGVAVVRVMRLSANRPHEVVPIQDGKTMDFSSGRAVVKNDPADEAALQKSVAEMNAAAGNVTFSPRGNQTTRK